MAKILNVTILTITVFAAAFCWLYYLTKNGEAAAFAATTIAAAFCLIAAKPNNKKDGKKPFAKTLERLAASLAVKGDEGQISAAFAYLGYEISQIEDDFVAEKSGEKTFVKRLFRVKKLCADDAIDVCKKAEKLGADAAVLFCNGIESSAVKYCAALPVKMKICDVAATYQFLSLYAKLPQSDVKIVKNTPVAQFALCRKRSGQYALSALFLFGVSFFSYFPVYSLAWASVLAVLALYSRFNKRFNCQSGVLP